MRNILRASTVSLLVLGWALNPAPALAASSPAAPVITEPAINGQLVSGADVHMETAPMQDADGDAHRCTDWEIWTVSSAERAWSARCVGGVLKVHIHLGDGVFENSYAGRSSLIPQLDYELRVRHRDDSGDPTTEWSPYSVRRFRTAPDRAPLPGAPEWTVMQAGYVVEKVADGFRLPVNIAPVPSYKGNPLTPMLYVAELYGSIKTVRGNLTSSVYATNLLNFNPTGQFPGSGEKGLTGIAVDPITGDVFASMVYASGGEHFPKVVRLHSNDGGVTANGQTTILDMRGEPQGPSHQISNLTIGPDGKLYIHVGDGFDFRRARNLESFQGKILRANLDGTAPSDNPFYNTADGLTARDYVYAYGFRNPFGGAWRASDGFHYEVENGPSVDRFARVIAGKDYRWDGTNDSIRTNAQYVWEPSHAPVNVDFIEPGRFHSSGFPEEKYGHAFVSESGPTYATGPQDNGKRIVEFGFRSDGSVIGPRTLVEYSGSGKSTVAGLASGPNGLYFTSLYADDPGAGPTGAQASLYRVRYDATRAGPPVTVYQQREFAGASQSFGGGIFESASGELSMVGNDSISSLRVTAGFRAVLCEHGSQGRTSLDNLGLCHYYGPGEYRFVGADLNDRISSIAVLGQPKSGTAVVAYQASSFGGASQAMGVGGHEAVSGELGQVGDDAISSLRVTKAYRVIACKHDRTAGVSGGRVDQCGFFGGGDYPSLGTGLDNQISLIAVGEALATVYQDHDFAGKAQSLSSGIHEAMLGELGGVGNDQISSLRISAGYRVVVCRHDHAGRTNAGDLGLCRFYGPGNHAFVGTDLNDAISLIAVLRTGSGDVMKAFQTRNFGGRTSSFGVGIYEAVAGELGAVGNDAISSLKLISKHRLVVCANDSYRRTNTGDLGLCRFYAPGDHNFVGADLNDTISLIALAT
jgi:glucose/arabinose dehydrogenase